MDCQYKKTTHKCNCTYNCDNHGKCCACISYHLKFNEFPACFFSMDAESTYDRRFEALLKDRKASAN